MVRQEKHPFLGGTVAGWFCPLRVRGSGARPWAPERPPGNISFPCSDVEAAFSYG